MTTPLTPREIEQARAAFESRIRQYSYAEEALERDGKGDYLCLSTFNQWDGFLAAYAEFAPRWRPISEALCDVRYLVCVCDNKRPATPTIARKADDGLWYGDSGFRITRNPTHYMPLPPPPEGEKV